MINLGWSLKVHRSGQKDRQPRPRWYGHVKREGDDYVGRKVSDVQLLGKRGEERPKRGSLDILYGEGGHAGGREYEAFEYGESAVGQSHRKWDIFL